MRSVACECGVSGSTEEWLCQFPRNDLAVLLDIALHYFIWIINWVNKTSKKEIIKTICDSVNHTRFPKEDHLPDWPRRDNKVTKGDRVECETNASKNINIKAKKQIRQAAPKLSTAKQFINFSDRNGNQFVGNSARPFPFLATHNTTQNNTKQQTVRSITRDMAPLKNSAAVAKLTFSCLRSNTRWVSPPRTSQPPSYGHT